jgi:rod shape-determining protein MreC
LAFREGPFQDLKVPLTWTGAAAAVIAIVVALALLFTDRREALGPEGYGARTEFDQVVEPVAGVLVAPVRWVRQGAGFVGGYFFAVSENRRLRQRVAELERWRDAAIALKNINTRYEQLLQLRTEPPIPMVSARVVTDARGPFSNARLADVGADRGVKVGNPVLSERGVVGRVVGVTRGVSRVLLLTDVDSRTPVLVDRTNARAILTGDGGPTPRLDYIRGRDPVKEGDLILTSGDGGIYPRGLPVGVAARDARGVWRVRLYADQSSNTRMRT